MTKNPTIMTSVNYIHSWFKNKIETTDDLARFNALDIIDADKYTLTSSLPKRQRLDRYNNIDDRLEMSRNGVKNEQGL